MSLKTTILFEAFTEYDFSCFGVSEFVDHGSLKFLDAFLSGLQEDLLVALDVVRKTISFFGRPSLYHGEVKPVLKRIRGLFD